MNLSKLRLAIGGAVVVILLAASPALAADFIQPDQTNEGNITVSSNEQHRNLYVAGHSVVVQSNTTGDLYAAAAALTVEGDTEQDVVVAGGNVLLNGKIGGDVRVISGNVAINGTVAGDVLVLGGTVRISEKSSVGGDLAVSGGNIQLDAPVSGYVRAVAGSIIINSKVGGQVSIRAGKSLVFGRNTDIAAQVNYASPKEALVQDGAKVGSLNYEQFEARHGKRAIGGLLTAAFLIKLLAWIVAGLVVLKLARHRLQVLAEEIYARPWLNLGVGFLILVAAPVAALILALLFVGYYLAILLFLTYILVLAFSGLVGAVFLGAWVIKLLTKQPALVLDWQAVVIGVVGYGILGLIPVVGWIIIAIISVTAFGAMVRFTRDRLQQEQNLAIISE